MPDHHTDIPTGLDRLFHAGRGLGKRLFFSVKRLRKDAVAAKRAGREAADLSEGELTEALQLARARMRRRHTRGEVVAALGVVSEAARRSLGVTPYVEQLMGVLAMGKKAAIEMQTGEGKTVTAAMAAVIAAWRGGPCHVVTSNDYLAKRDAQLMAPLFQRCGVSVGHVVAGMQPTERKAAYLCDVTYSTSKELLADHLRDRMALGGRQGENRARALAGKGAEGDIPGAAVVMRGLHTAIVDEADSVLVDEATVPLIISLPNKNNLLHEAVLTAKRLAESLTAGEDYLLAVQGQQVILTAAGKKRLQAATAALPALWHSEERSRFLVCQALSARHFYHKDVQYVVTEGKVVIVDDKTGRIMEGRSWSGGLHQAVEAKEGVELTDPTYSHTQMSFQLFFRLYRHLCGMSGTLQNVEAELWGIYELQAIRIPTHVPKRMTHQRERIFATGEQKWVSVLEDIRQQIGSGRAVLVGTHSVRESEELYGRVRQMGLEATVLNALRHEEEAAIIARAGEPGRITIATNMAGRGTDIRVAAEVIGAGGLHVIATERHESRRVDMQLFGRTARQGVPGSVGMLTSLDDEIFRRYAPGWLVREMKRLTKLGCGEALALMLNRYNQRRAEKAKARLRKEILLQDIRQSKALSFADI